MITSPTLLLDEQKCRANIRRMAQKARNLNLSFRPHFKTHQSADIGKWFHEEGINGITVSSVRMAYYFYGHGWENITIAFPVNIREVSAINNLAEKCNLGLLISDSNALEKLEPQITCPVDVLIEIDTGSHRSGFLVSGVTTLNRVIDTITDSKNFRFAGFYSHPGHSYASRSDEEVLKVHQGVLEQVSELKSRYDYPVTIGDTPCCSVGNEFPGVDSISPGNFVFYDVMQVEIGSCSISDIAVALACPVVAKYPERKEMVIYGGAVHLSKEHLVKNGETHFGIAVPLASNSWDTAKSIGHLKALSQEHGILRCKSDQFNSLDIGDLVAILPVHSCLTANVMAGYQTMDGVRLNHMRSS